MNDDAQTEKDLHDRLLACDPTAPEEVARKYLPRILRHVAIRAHSHGIHDPDLINDATVEAVIMYLKHPEKFDPNKSGLLGYLKRAAERDLINFSQQDRRRRRGEELLDDVEDSILSRNKSSEIDRIGRNSVEDETILRIQTERDLVKIEPENDRDKLLLRLMAEGERSTVKFAAVLGITDLPTTEQRHIVKKHKDRLKLQLKRGRSKSRA